MENKKENKIDIHERYAKMTDNEKNAFTIGRLSVLNDFDALCKADAFMGLSEVEFGGVKKFFSINNQLREAHNN